MSRYRKVESQTWTDEKFCALSPMPPSGQGLWLYLLTGPRTCIVPGLLMAGRAAMAEELGWPQEAFDEAFAEAFQLGMVKADWKARLVWLPNALRESNKPESLNVAIAWRKEFNLLPNCDLKRAAGDAIRVFLSALGPKYLAAFAGDQAYDAGADKASPKPSRKPSGKTSAKSMPNQEQEQEQKEDLSPRDEPRPRVATLVPRRRLDAAWEWERGYVLQRQHEDFVRRLGGDVGEAEQRLFAFYDRTVKLWPATEPVPDAFVFWNPRFDAEFVKAAPRVTAPAKVAGLTGGGVAPSVAPATWLCPHEPRCGHRTACALTTARDVRAGRVGLDDVQPALRAEVREYTTDEQPAQAVHA